LNLHKRLGVTWASCGDVDSIILLEYQRLEKQDAAELTANGLLTVFREFNILTRKVK
jgi:hypothetical protein